MNDAQLKALFPNASQAFFARNGGVPHSGALALLEPDLGHEPLGAGGVQKAGDGRFSVRVTSVRLRLLDQDNLCEKYVVDCCRYAGLLPGDGPGQTHIQADQRKCSPGEAEHIEVTIQPLD